MDSPELLRIGLMVKGGILPADRSQACLVHWQKAQRAGLKLSLADVFVRAGLLTPTQGAVVARESLVQRQPFPNYRLLRQVGEGGMAIVFEATYTPVNARVALKVLDVPFCLQERYRLRFKREAGILLALEHENIVEGREHSTVDGVDYYAMAFVDGISILDLLDQGVKLSERFCLHVGVQVASALAEMHAKGIVHRDIKPANLVVDPAGHVRIVDFGLAKVMGGMRQDTGDDTTVGTIEYMSPEQAQGRSDVDGRSDVYSLGASLFHMLTGELPFGGSSQAEIMHGHVKRQVEFTPAQAARVSPPLQYVVRRMMAKSPDERYPTPQALLDEIGTLCAGILARPLDVPPHVRDTALEAAPIANKPLAPVRRRPTGPGARRSGRHHRR